MKTISLISTMLVLPAASLLAQGQSELDLLKARIDVQERRISQLESALSRLNTGAVTSTTAPKKAAAPAKKAPVAHAGEYTVKQGDTLTRIAARHQTSVEAIKQVNGLKSDGLMVGQKLRLPAAQSAAAKTTQPVPAKKAEVASKAPAKAPAPQLTGKYKVKAGDTFYGIARRYNMSEATLQAANPTAVPTRLQIGQELLIDAKAKPASKPAAPVAKSNANKPIDKPVVKKTAMAKSSTPAPAPKKRSSIRTITVNEQMTYGAFANRHGASTSQLNSLNGLNLSKSTMLAKGSELYVPEF
ncbi:LysM peptidoglycan-binding domain-containing protein [Verrucomicrobiaceae bacterium N1E253]|uniref:LysM peptidoglycan-binding domain-containing protein n=1 Tax=Oceaniferula marina TaxID=2748318 RepID=A0A851GDI3_9BACT|nr:LysM peptidoglycan-binding domain-containing protein [Oceaniferula marina]NWK55476.1 LysM peptidoglycan-binding domain-containing protein [Oceaniferula marina]